MKTFFKYVWIVIFSFILIVGLLIFNIEKSANITQEIVECPVVTHEGNWVYIHDFATTGEAYFNGDHVHCETNMEHDIDLSLLDILNRYETFSKQPELNQYNYVLEVYADGTATYIEKSGNIDEGVYSSWYPIEVEGKVYMRFLSQENTYILFPNGNIALVIRNN